MAFRTNILKNICIFNAYRPTNTNANLCSIFSLTENCQLNTITSTTICFRLESRAIHTSTITILSSKSSSNFADEDSKKKSYRRPLRKFVSNFFDTLRIHVRGGTGGKGVLHRNGIGGNGGDVVLVGEEKMTLKDVADKIPSRRASGKTGENARLFCLLGSTPEPTYVKVPIGVTVLNDLGIKLGEINKSGDQVLAAKGGLGGREENGYAPCKGEAHNIKLDLKIIADVGFVGFPNAGKSTLLRAISNAKPKVASYPFTTVRPNVGMASFPNGRQISLADLPGLIEGAHANIGMGHKFLKHVERTKVLLFIVDVHGFQLSPLYSARSAIDTIILLNKELELYDPSLLEKPAILALNKVDLPDSYPKVQQTEDILCSDELLNEAIDKMPEECRPEHLIKFERITAISAAKDVNSVVILKSIIRETIDLHSELRRQKMDKLEESSYSG